MPTPTVIKVDLKDPDYSRIRSVAEEVKRGKLAVFPTETVYGVGGPVSQEGIEKSLRDLKGRAESKPFSFQPKLLSPSLESLFQRLEFELPF